MGVLNQVIPSFILFVFLSLSSIVASAPQNNGIEWEEEILLPLPHKSPAAVHPTSQETNYSRGCSALQKDDFESAEKAFIKSKAPQAKSMRALMYLRKQLGKHLESKVRYQLIEEWLIEANTPVAKANRARMYMQKQLGGDLPRMERYRFAARLLQDAGTKGAQRDLQTLIAKKLYTPEGCGPCGCIVM
jgi:hypothetical protein